MEGLTCIKISDFRNHIKEYIIVKRPDTGEKVHGKD